MAKSIIEATNTKTGKSGFVITRYNRISDGAAMVEVNLGLRKAYWRVDHVRIAEITL